MLFCFVSPCDLERTVSAWREIIFGDGGNVFTLRFENELRRISSSVVLEGNNKIDKSQCAVERILEPPGVAFSRNAMNTSLQVIRAIRSMGFSPGWPNEHTNMQIIKTERMIVVSLYFLWKHATTRDQGPLTGHSRKHQSSMK